MCLNEKCLEKLLPPGMKLENFVVTPQMQAENEKKANQKLSRTVQVFQPVDVISLKNISDGDDGGIKKGDIVQIMMDPGGNINLGYFTGMSGTCYKERAIEGKDFTWAT